MSRYRRVVWNEGMLLTPHHFQQWDNYYEELLSSRFASAAPYEWAVLDFHANNEATANGNLDLIRCRAVLPGGGLVSVPETGPAPAPRPRMDHFDPVAAKLAIRLACQAQR